MICYNLLCFQRFEAGKKTLTVTKKTLGVAWDLGTSRVFPRTPRDPGGAHQGPRDITGSPEIPPGSCGDPVGPKDNPGQPGLLYHVYFENAGAATEPPPGSRRGLFPGT